MTSVETLMQAEIERLREQNASQSVHIISQGGEIEGLREDAERWRTLVTNSSYLDYSAVNVGALISPPFRRWYHDSTYETATFADAIDAARKGEA